VPAGPNICGCVSYVVSHPNGLLIRGHTVRGIQAPMSVVLPSEVTGDDRRRRGAGRQSRDSKGTIHRAERITNGASDRANAAPLPAGPMAAGAVAGAGGICACGPEACHPPTEASRDEPGK